MIFDTHAHYNLPPFDINWKPLWDEARLNGVSDSIIVGVDVVTSQKAITIAEQDDHLFATVGVHPSDASVWNEIVEDSLRQMATHPKVIAIGETGLDYARINSEDLFQVRERQIAVFRKQIRLARELNKPLIIHAREAYEDILQILRSEQLPPSVVLHCMSGSLDYQRNALELGCYCSFAGNVTYASAQNIRELAKHTPLDKLLLETDAPFLPPQSKRGKTNAPENITETAQYLANLFHSTMEEICEITHTNARKCFLLD